MKKFIKNLLVFILCFLVFVLACFIIWKQFVAVPKFDKSTAVLILGDSHTESGINDSLIKNTINISSNSEHYLYTYNVIRHILDPNPQVKTIILGCSFHSFDAYDPILFEGDRAQVFYENYFPILDFSSMATLVYGNPSGIYKSRKIIFQNFVHSVLNQEKNYRDYPYIGQYYKSDLSHLNDTTVDITIQRHFYQENGQEQEFSNYQKIYFKKIVDLCTRKHIKLIIINTPISELYYQKIPAKFISNYNTTITSFKNQIEFWDFYSLPLEKKCYGDGDHLNSFGANILSSKIDSLLRLRK